MLSPSPVTRDQIVSAAQLACLLEASAPKPGNVFPGRDFHDTTYADFLAAAAAIGPALALAPDRSLGETILAGIAASRAWTSANVNLGIVLLLAPLARAALEPPGHPPLRERVARVLDATTVADAERTYEAIRLAQPAGLGHAAQQDVATAPTLTLRDAMSLAAERDGIAREYATGFRTTFEHGAPAIVRARADGLSWNESVVETFLTLLAAAPDTHIARKLGLDEAQEVSHRAAQVLAAGGVRTDAGRAAIVQLDGYLRDSRNARNPGTTADLCAAAIFVALLGGAW